MTKKYLSVKELADILNISRIAVFNKIKNGQIYAEKVGRNYIIPVDKLEGIGGAKLSKADINKIEKGVNRVVDEYEEALKMLAKE